MARKTLILSVLKNISSTFCELTMLILFISVTFSVTSLIVAFLPCDAMHKRGYCRHAVSVRPSVCPSVTFVSCAKTNKDIFKIISPSVAKSF